MSLDQDIATLASVSLFRFLHHDALRLLAFASETRIVRTDDVLFRKNETTKGGYVVMRGALALDAREDGSPSPFRAGVGTLLGQRALFLENTYQATATAVETTSVMYIPRTLMERMVNEFPETADALHRALSEDLHDLSAQLAEVRVALLKIDAHV
jgi:CRP-like cAMP-binding protein